MIRDLKKVMPRFGKRRMKFFRMVKSERLCCRCRGKGGVYGILVPNEAVCSRCGGTGLEVYWKKQYVYMKCKVVYTDDNLSDILS